MLAKLRSPGNDYERLLWRIRYKPFAGSAGLSHRPVSSIINSMPRIRRLIPAVKIEYVCDRYEQGISVFQNSNYC